MNTLNWSESLALQHAQIDQTHQEFVALLNRWGAALAGQDEAEMLSLYEALLAHTEAHFAMEEGWMAATGFAPENCHSKQHAMVLDVMRQVLAHVQAQRDFEPMRNLLPELLNWFPAHAEMMDASLVYHMKEVGFDAATGHLAKPLPAAAISSCGSSSCS
ncbi:hemerythrin domain-containing protein [Roseateles koreensis]|uniref:Hemerythrin domain-containing protein n=1 Tax=Roseateles koreensis TaxID=2987526 RepID=A0ABT5KNE6_9BURK|nr:hemerythrin domain-containing protein [Roseateles koreensis]MDC8784366.1 hemerythrin domain-containing protein [Roseateles koreensis]